MLLETNNISFYKKCDHDYAMKWSERTIMKRGKEITQSIWWCHVCGCLSVVDEKQKRKRWMKPLVLKKVRK